MTTLWHIDGSEEPEGFERCPRCNGRGRFISDETRWLDPCDGDFGHECWERCLECEGTGEIELP